MYAGRRAARGRGAGATGSSGTRADGGGRVCGGSVLRVLVDMEVDHCGRVCGRSACTAASACTGALMCRWRVCMYMCTMCRWRARCAAKWQRGRPHISVHTPAPPAPLDPATFRHGYHCIQAFRHNTTAGRVHMLVWLVLCVLRTWPIRRGCSRRDDHPRHPNSVQAIDVCLLQAGEPSSAHGAHRRWAGWAHRGPRGETHRGPRGETGRASSGGQARGGARRDEGGGGGARGGAAALGCGAARGDVCVHGGGTCLLL